MKRYRATNGTVDVVGRYLRIETGDTQSLTLSQARPSVQTANKRAVSCLHHLRGSYSFVYVSEIGGKTSFQESRPDQMRAWCIKSLGISEQLGNID